MKSKPSARRSRVTYPLALEKPLYARVAKVADKTGMSRQVVMHMSIERGLDVLMNQLSSEAPASSLS